MFAKKGVLFEFEELRFYFQVTCWMVCIHDRYGVLNIWYFYIVPCTKIVMLTFCFCRIFKKALHQCTRLDLLRGHCPTTPGTRSIFRLQSGTQLIFVFAPHEGVGYVWWLAFSYQMMPPMWVLGWWLLVIENSSHCFNKSLHFIAWLGLFS